MILCSNKRPGRILQFNVKENSRSYKAKGRQRCNEYILYDVGAQVCCCVFTGKYINVFLCFN